MLNNYDIDTKVFHPKRPLFHPDQEALWYAFHKHAAQWGSTSTTLCVHYLYSGCSHSMVSHVVYLPKTFFRAVIIYIGSFREKFLHLTHIAFRTSSKQLLIL